MSYGCRMRHVRETRRSASPELSGRCGTVISQIRLHSFVILATVWPIGHLDETPPRRRGSFRRQAPATLNGCQLCKPVTPAAPGRACWADASGAAHRRGQGVAGGGGGGGGGRGGGGGGAHRAGWGGAAGGGG